ncbi:MAG: cyclic AMP receptor-like protein [marine bacterium B5-7]|nr:MAG: cyclic AMP receptor-like protein [marine bacterium B5-7]
MLSMSIFRSYRAKETIIEEGSVSDSVCYILKGSVTVESYDDNGQRLVFSYVRPGEFFGELGLFHDQLKRSATVVARTDCEVAIISIADFKQLINEDQALLFELARQLADKLRKTSEKLSNLAFLDVTGRVARTLIDLIDDDEAITHPDGMMIRITREELGRLVNCSREMAGNVLHILEDQGLIHLDGRSIVVHRSR